MHHIAKGTTVRDVGIVIAMGLVRNPATANTKMPQAGQGNRRMSK